MAWVEFGCRFFEDYLCKSIIERGSDECKRLFISSSHPQWRLNDKLRKTHKGIRNPQQNNTLVYLQNRPCEGR